MPYLVAIVDCTHADHIVYYITQNILTVSIDRSKIASANVLCQAEYCLWFYFTHIFLKTTRFSDIH